MSRFASFLDIASLWAPSRRLSMSQWAEEHFFLSSEYSAKTGFIRLKSWQKGIFDAYSNPTTHTVVLMCATQMVKTLFLQVSSAFDICEDPGPILFVGYKDDDANKFSKERFAPMTRDIIPLGARISPAKSRDANNTVEHKRFPGGVIEFVGSLAPANLGRRTIRYLKFDEVDQYDLSSGGQGHAVDLGLRRTAHFGSRRKVILASSPTIKGRSRIGQAYDESDRRRGWVACHKCGNFQILLWNQVIFNSKLEIADAAASAFYECAHCNAAWTEQERLRNIAEAFEWRPAEGARFEGMAGFSINHLYSELLLHSLSNLTREWLESKHDRERRKVFINTDLAELWEEEGERPDWERIMAHSEIYRVGQDHALPEEVVFLMQGVDVQAKRLEVQTLGFGTDSTGAVHIWVVDYGVIELFEPTGEAKTTTALEYWDELGRRLDRQYAHPSGAKLPVIAMCVDVGHNADPVYTFAKRYPQPSYGPMGLEILSPRTVLCVRGFDKEHLSAIHRVTERETARLRKGAGHDLPIVTLGTGYLKTELYSELMGRSDLRRIHLSRDLSEPYFRGIVAEKRVQSAKGEISWDKIYPRNEPLDTWVYAKGGFYCFRADRFTKEQWNKLRRKFGIPEAVDEARRDKPAAKPGRTVASPYLD